MILPCFHPKRDRLTYDMDRFEGDVQVIETLRQRVVELEAYNEELEAFAHTVAHSLQNALSVIVGYAETLERFHTTMSDEELCSYLHSTTQAGLRMSNMIEELLLLSKVRNGDVKTGPLDMATIVDGTIQRLAYVVEEHQAEIILPEAWPVALGYGPWVEEVWINYLSNAIKYGGQPPRVELGAMVQADKTVHFWVRDNGPGLTPEDQTRLFLPFKRLDQVHIEGHGLGLSIVRRILEKLGGQVGVQSGVGQGSVFTFVLPGAASEAE